MQELKALEIQFLSDADKVSKDFINFFGLRHASETAHLSEPTLRWFDFVCRYIPPSKRVFIRARNFPKELAPDIQKALNHLERLSQLGVDINPYQTKGLIFYNDTSGTKRRQRTDLLWADWGIHHLHLSTDVIRSEEYFVTRSPWLLFCLVVEDSIGLIDIRYHGEAELFSNPRLIKEVIESWPEFMERYRLKGVLPARDEISAEDIRKLREAGITTHIVSGSNAYRGPGMGVTTASTPTRVSVTMNRVRRLTRELAKVVYDSNSQFKMESISAGCLDPEFSLGLSPKGLIVYEKKQDKGFILPRQISANGSFIAELHDLLAPQWALDFAMKMTTSE